MTAAACRAGGRARSAHGELRRRAVGSQCLIAATNVVDVAERAGALRTAAKEGATLLLSMEPRRRCSASCCRRARRVSGPWGRGRTGVRGLGSRAPTGRPHPAAPPRSAARRRRRWLRSRARAFERKLQTDDPYERVVPRARATSGVGAVRVKPGRGGHVAAAFWRFLDAPVSVFPVSHQRKKRSPCSRARASERATHRCAPRCFARWTPPSRRLLKHP